MGVKVRGFIAWAICRFYHLAWMAGIRRKVRLVNDWTVDFWFRRDTAELGHSAIRRRSTMSRSPRRCGPHRRSPNRLATGQKAVFAGLIAVAFPPTAPVANQPREYFGHRADDPHAAGEHPYAHAAIRVLIRR
jgi:hypothetical protein